MEHTKRAIVVGGSSGIGFEVCSKLINRNWNVTNISRTPCKLEKVINEIADVAAGSTFTDIIDRACKKNATVDVLIYSAGFSMASPIEFAKEKDYRYLFDVNFFGALKAMQAVIPYMKVNGGKIILVGSLGGELPILFDSFYSASKAALEMLAREAYLELKPYNIFVTAFLPGGTKTEFTFKRKVYSEDESRDYTKDVKQAVEALAEMEQNGMSPCRVADDLFEIILSDKPPVVKVSGLKNSAYRFLSHVVPEKMTLYFDDRMYRE